MVSVVIPNWNGESTIRECLDSLQKQSFRDFEVIVVDNGSVDRSAAIIQSEYPKIRLVALRENAGFTGGCNLGISKSRGDLIALFNNDMIAAPDWLEQLVLASRRNSSVSMFASKIFWKEGEGKLFSAGDILLKSGKSEGRGHNEKDSEAYGREEEVFGPCAGAALYRRSFFENVGYFDEDFFAYIEDTDLSLRGQLKNHRCLYVSSAVTYHYGMHSLKTQSDLRVGYCLRNYFYFLIKNYPSGLFVENFRDIAKTMGREIRFAFSHFRCTAGFVYASRRMSCLFCTVLIKMPSMFRKRRQIQGSMRIPPAAIRCLMR